MVSPQQHLAFVRLVRQVLAVQGSRALQPRLKGDAQFPLLCAQLNAEAAVMEATLLLDIAEVERETAEIERERDESRIEPGEWVQIRAKLDEWKTRYPTTATAAGEGGVR